MKLLIVEDNPAVRRMIRIIVSQVADDIAEAADGRAALRIYANERPDVVLMDINLGDSDGIETTRRLREFDPAARVMIVSSFDHADLRAAAAKAGAFAYVIKEDLFATLDHLAF